MSVLGVSVVVLVFVIELGLNSSVVFIICNVELD